MQRKALEEEEKIDFGDEHGREGFLYNPAQRINHVAAMRARFAPIHQGSSEAAVCATAEALRPIDPTHKPKSNVPIISPRVLLSAEGTVRQAQIMKKFLRI